MKRYLKNSTTLLIAVALIGLVNPSSGHAAVKKKASAEITASINDKSVTLNWRYKNGSPKSQTISVLGTNGALNGVKYKLNKSTRSFVISNLSPNIQYSFMLDGKSPSIKSTVEVVTPVLITSSATSSSSASTATPTPTPTPTPTRTPTPTPTPSTATKVQAPTDLKAVVSSNSVALTWVAPKDYASNGTYRVELSFGSNNYTLIGTTTELNYKIVALSEGKIYDFRVAAVVNGTVGEYSQVIRVIPTPSVQPTPTPSPTPSPSTQAVEAPLNLYAVANTTPGTVRLTWSKSPTSGPVSRDRIEISNPTSGWVLVGDTPGTGLAADVNSLYAGVAYQFRVSAVGDTQTSVPSNVFTYTIPQTNITPPGVVQNLRASLSGSDVMLAWNTPAVLNGAPVTSHKLQVSIDNISWIDLADGNSSLSAILKGLESKRSYFFRVAAVNSAGTGLWSQVIKVTMP